MLFEEIIPHLNKISSLVLMNNKRRVGYIFLDQAAMEKSECPEVIYFLSVMKTQLLLRPEPDLEKMKEMREEIPLCEIRKVKSVF